MLDDSHNAYTMTKDSLFNAGLFLVYPFARLNGLRAPLVREGRPAGITRDGGQPIITVNVNGCKKPSRTTLNFPCYSEDETPVGALALQTSRYFIKLIGVGDTMNPDSLRLFILNPELLRATKPLDYARCSSHFIATEARDPVAVLRAWGAAPNLLVRTARSMHGL